MLLDTIYTDIQPTKISDFLKVDNSLYQMDKKAFIIGYSTVITSELYLLRPEDGPESLMHKNGKQISPVDRIWPIKSQMVVVKKEPTSNQVQVYDRSGNLFRELDNWPQSLELPKREFFTWADNNRKVGILDAGFNTIIPPQYDAVYLLSNIPEQFRVFWVKYAFRNPEHLFVGWIWNSDKTVPLLIKENGKVVSVREL